MKSPSTLITFYPAQMIQGIGKRSNQEDSCYPNVRSKLKNSRFFIVCDGVGGHQKGEVASRLVCREVAATLKKQPSSSRELILQAVQNATLAVHQYAAKHDNVHGMGTTFTLLSASHDRLWAAHIGDSRIYQFRNGAILLRTKDHSLVQMLVDQKEITEEEAKNHPRKNVILKSINDSEDVKPDIHEITDLQPEDIFLLCTDGILEAWSDAELSALMAGKESLEQKAEKIALACKEISNDNHTAILAQVQDAPYKKPWWKSIFKR